MENTASKSEVLKPVILKAGVPLAVSVAGFIYAWIMAKKSLSKASSSSENSTENNSHQEPKSEESYHSLGSVEDEGHGTTPIDASFLAESSQIHDTPCFEQEINGLRSRIESMQMRELALRLQFDQYCDLKEQESLLGEIKNFLSLETARVDFLDREISSMETGNKRLENFVVQYLRVIEQIEYWKSENRLLRRKIQKLLRKSKAQTRMAKEKALKIKAEEAEISRNHDALHKLEGERRELQRVLGQLQDEKNELLKKLDATETSYASKIEAGDISREDYKQLLDELENIKKERADEAKELIYLRWTNACLRHDIMRHHEQEENQDRNHIELEFGGSDEVIHYDSEHELHNSHLEHHSTPSSEEHHSAHHRDSALSKRTKLLERLKRWVEGGEKARVRHSVSRVADEHQVPARRSCSSACV